MPSMPGPSSCVKNWDATLRRVILSPLLPAMPAVPYRLEKERRDQAPGPCGWAGPSPPLHKGLNPPFHSASSLLGLPKSLPDPRSVSDLGVIIWEKLMPPRSEAVPRGVPSLTPSTFTHSRLTTNVCRMTERMDTQQPPRWFPRPVLPSGLYSGLEVRASLLKHSSEEPQSQSPTC